MNGHALEKPVNQHRKLLMCTNQECKCGSRIAFIFSELFVNNNFNIVKTKHLY